MDAITAVYELAQTAIRTKDQRIQELEMTIFGPQEEPPKRRFLNLETGVATAVPPEDADYCTLAEAARIVREHNERKARHEQANPFDGTLYRQDPFAKAMRAIRACHLAGQPAIVKLPDGTRMEFHPDGTQTHLPPETVDDGDEPAGIPTDMLPPEAKPAILRTEQDRPQVLAALVQDIQAGPPLNTLARRVIEINTANGWNVTKPHEWADSEYKVPAILALVHSEVSEALEAFRKDDKAHFLEEMADVVIRVLDCAGGLGLDMDTAIQAKLEKNKGRGFRHGGKRV